MALVGNMEVLNGKIGKEFELVNSIVAITNVTSIGLSRKLKRSCQE